MTVATASTAAEKLAEGIDMIRRGLEILQGVEADTGSEEPVTPST